MIEEAADAHLPPGVGVDELHALARRLEHAALHEALRPQLLTGEVECGDPVICLELEGHLEGPRSFAGDHDLETRHRLGEGSCRLRPGSYATARAMVDLHPALSLVRRLAAADPAAAAEVAALGEAELADLRRDAPRALALPPEEVLDVLDAVLLAAEAPRALELLAATGLCAVLLPEVEALRGFHEGFRVHHKDLWLHTLEVIERMAPDRDLRWAALLHDIGKIATRDMDEGGRATFHHHERVGAAWARGIFARLGLPAERATRITWILEQHGRVNAYEPGWSDRAVRRLAREAGDGLQDLLAFSRADFTTRRKRKAARIRRHLEHLEGRLERLAAEDAWEARAALPRGTGDHVREALGLDPHEGGGPALREAIDWLRAEVAVGSLPRDAEPEVYVEALLEAREGAGGSPQKG